MPGSDPSDILVFGPAYLDRVVRVDRPLLDPGLGDRPVDGGVDGARLGPAEGLVLVDPLGSRIVLELPDDWPGPRGTVGLSRPLSTTQAGWSRTVRVRSWSDDLGGMGAGFAAAMGGELACALGPEDDPASRTIAGLLDREGVRHHPIRVEGRPADWTLLVTSGEFGDKLAVGFRGCHAAVGGLGTWSARPCRVRVVASLPNRLAVEALRGPGAIRAFAPSMRNILDRDPPVSAFADSIDVLGCNRSEWDALIDRDEVARRLSILAVTDGPRGAVLLFTTPEGHAARAEVPAFPRARPLVDTNRAGEAFASTLFLALLEGGWTPGPLAIDLARSAAGRASVAAALVLDRDAFGFPTAREVDDALRAGRVG